jgi:hypothetical protein
MSLTVDDCLDEAWCEEGQRDRHAKHVSLMLGIPSSRGNLGLYSMAALMPATLCRAMAGTDANC